jgi:regulator of cell morphogenesis and NO signaling
MKMAEVIHLNYQLLPILSRFGLHLGFGEKTIEQLCLEHGIDVNFFLIILNAYHDKNFFPHRHLKGFPLNLLISYLRKSHEYFLTVKIPLIEQLLDKLSPEGDVATTGSLQLINRFFGEYCTELTEHIQREEDKVYPYAFMVEEAFLSGIPGPGVLEGIREYSIDDYESEHDNVEDKLNDLQNIILKYLPSTLDLNLCHTLLTEIFRLESDLNDHARIEDKVLVPKVKLMEKVILEKEGR